MQKMSLRKQRIAERLDPLGLAFDGQKVNGVYRVGIVACRTLDEVEAYIKELEQDNAQQSVVEAGVVEAVKPAESWQDWRSVLKHQKVGKERTIRAMINIPRNPDFSKHAEKSYGKDAYPCVICGKPCPTSPFSVHVHGGGDVLVTEEEASRLDESGDLGMYPIGKDCLQKHPELRPYVNGHLQKTKETQKWLVSFYSAEGQLKDAVEHFGRTKPLRWAKARLYEGETVKIEVLQD